ncbi:MAG: transketolase, partial [Beijerinckiaceae bacterium]
PEAAEAHAILHAQGGTPGLLAITSPGKLHADWLARRSQSHIARLLADAGRDSRLVCVADGHPAGLSWLGAVAGNPVHPLGVTAFGESADIPDLFGKHGLDAAAIVRAATA